MNEFDIIKNFFNKKISPSSHVLLGIGDDCAIVNIPADHQLAITTDTLVEGVHFIENTSPYDIGYKSLAVNLSDLAAMGAEPAWFTLAISLSNDISTWLKEFADGLFDLANTFHIPLIGGDLTKSTTLTITITAYGFLKKNNALTRSNAKVDDRIYVSETLGDAAFGLSLLKNKISLPDKDRKYFLQKLNRPLPQIELGKKLLPIAHAAIDISDGLVADLSHILKQSGVGAKINVDAVPLSNEIKQHITKDQAIALALSGGDDYELCFTVPADSIDLVPPGCTSIGIITQSPELRLEEKDGTTFFLQKTGYKHFD